MKKTQKTRMMIARLSLLSSAASIALCLFRSVASTAAATSSHACFLFAKKPISWQQGIVRSTDGIHRGSRDCDSCHRQRRCLKSKRRDTARNDDDSVITVDHADFWGVRISRHSKDDAAKDKIPFDRNLDPFDGPLPPGAYRSLKVPSSSSSSSSSTPARQPIHSGSKKACAISMAVKPQTNFKRDDMEIVCNMQRMIDGGFNTFLFQETDLELLRMFNRETPNHVVDGCHFVLPYSVPMKQFSKTNVRGAVLSLLGRTGLSEIDTLQLDDLSRSPYFLDVLDCLTELQYDGYLRSISIKDDMATKANNIAEQNGFFVDLIHSTGNLVQHPRNHDGYDGIKAWCSSPLLGGLLTEKYLEMEFTPELSTLSPSERRHWQTTMASWAKRKTGKDVTRHETLWSMYKRDILSPLNQIALKYDMPMDCIALRWSLQRSPKSIESVTATSSFVNVDNEKNFDRHVHLRKVFQFQLEKDDMEFLNELSCESSIVSPHGLGIEDAEMDILLGSDKYLLGSGGSSGRGGNGRDGNSGNAKGQEIDEKYLLRRHDNDNDNDEDKRQHENADNTNKKRKRRRGKQVDLTSAIAENKQFWF